MSIQTRTILAAVLLAVPGFAAAYPASSDRAEPIAQVYEVQGRVTVKGSADAGIRPVKKGCLLAADDSLTLDKSASVAVYFKNGGRKEVRAHDAQVLCKVADLVPKAEAYDQSVALFGATRGIASPQAPVHAANFFYPQEAVILDSQPLIEFTVFRDPGADAAPGGATLQIVKGGVVLDSEKFTNLAFGSAYVYEPADLIGPAEYGVKLSLEILDNVVTVSFPLYIAGIPDAGPASKYAPFGNTVYRSVESTSIDFKGKKRTITALKQLAGRGSSPQPVIVIELFIP